MKRSIVFAWMGVCVLSCVASAQPSITIQANQPGARISPTMYGIFYEDINYGADGGLYAELIMNRSFEFPKPLRGWREERRRGADVALTVLRNAERPENPRYIRIEVKRAGQGFGLTSEGFHSVAPAGESSHAIGIPVKQGAQYRFSVEARRISRDRIDGLRVELIGKDGAVLGQGRVSGFKTNWGTYECLITANATDSHARMTVWVEGTGTVDLDMVSLFPKDTWKGRKNGLRADLVQMLADMNPGFLRFPGGCIVEGFDLSQRYQWKQSIGDPNERVQNINRWNFEFSHRPSPDYYQTYGLGYYEFFLLAEDLGAEPMPIVTCGMACQFNTAELVPMDQLNPYVQDMLDLIEFANGPVDSKWGKIRADMGHPEPFNMKMIGIGNEQWGPQYVERYKVFAKAIKAKYPDMQFVAATGSDARYFANGEAEIEYLWSEWKKLKPEFVDEHFYRGPDWFLDNADRYDSFDRNDPKVIVSEYAAHSSHEIAGRRQNNWESALAEAAMMTGFERNADVVRMTAYAPLLANVEAWQWSPDLIWFDNDRVMGTPNYYVQQLFGVNPGDAVLPVELSNVPKARNQKPRFYASATQDEQAGDVILKVVNVTDQAQTASISLQGVTCNGSTAKVTTLSSDKLTNENTLDEPSKIVPVTRSLAVSGSDLSYEFAPYSLTIIRVPVKSVVVLTIK